MKKRRSNLRRDSGFTLVELMVVIVIVLILTGLSVAGLSSNTTRGAHGAASTAYEMFGQARTEAIMRQTPCAVIVDTANKTDSTKYLRRMAVAYQSGTVSGKPVWSQASPWITLPASTYFDRNWSTLNGSGTITFNGTGAATGYTVFAFNPTGEAYNPYGSTTLAQFVISVGSVDSSGNFNARNPVTTTVNPSTSGTSAISKTAYGFVLFPMGRMAFIQDMVNDPSTPVNTFTP